MEQINYDIKKAVLPDQEELLFIKHVFALVQLEFRLRVLLLSGQ